MSASYTAGLVLTICLLLQVGPLETNTLQELTGYADAVVALLLPMNCT